MEKYNGDETKTERIILVNKFGTVFWIFFARVYRIHEIRVPHQRPNEEDALFHLHADVYLENAVFPVFHVGGYVLQGRKRYANLFVG